ncbi:hypothetical protein [Herbiconiux sp. YIM B11900]|uniref:hypothetical protein n=1 Tax=Herbiconiux sp. YIM B11900 TaxID=3404131 RepID=UPI003F862704
MTSDQEARWPGLAADAIDEFLNGRRHVATVWFETDAGVTGSIPVTERSSITFVDEAEPEGFLGALALFGPEAEPTQ